MLLWALPESSGTKCTPYYSENIGEDTLITAQQITLYRKAEGTVFRCFSPWVPPTASDVIFPESPSSFAHWFSPQHVRWFPHDEPLSNFTLYVWTEDNEVNTSTHELLWEKLFVTVDSVTSSFFSVKLWLSFIPNSMELLHLFLFPPQCVCGCVCVVSRDPESHCWIF